MPVRGKAKSNVKVLHKILQRRRRQASVAVVLWFRRQAGEDSCSPQTGHNRCFSSFPPLTTDNAIAESADALPTL